MTRAIALLALCACASVRSETGPEELGAGSGELRAAMGPEERGLAMRAEAQVERDDPEGGALAAARLARKHGGYVADLRESALTLIVPGNELDPLLDELPSLGKVTERSQSARALAAPLRDLRARIDNLEHERARYLELLARAESIPDTAAVEREVERVTGELEALEAQARALEGSVAEASVRIAFSRPVKPGPIGYLFWGLAAGAKWLFIRD